MGLTEAREGRGRDCPEKGTRGGEGGAGWPGGREERSRQRNSHCEGRGAEGCVPAGSRSSREVGGRRGAGERWGPRRDRAWAGRTQAAMGSRRGGARGRGLSSGRHPGPSMEQLVRGGPILDAS